MLFSKAGLVAGFAALSTLVSAQTTTTDAASPSGSVKVHVVKVGSTDGTTLKYDPADLTAGVGEMVQFQFYPKNHSVVQASFADPCIPISESSSGNGTVGFFSGFMAVSTSDQTMPTFTIMINDTKPIWYYCSQAKHCQSGMVGVINAPANNPNKTLATFMAAAAAAPENLSPGQTSSGGSSSGGYNTATGTNTASQSTATGAAPGMAGLAKSGLSMSLVAVLAAMVLA